MCAREGVEPISTFREEVRRGWRGDVRGPFNAEAREKAGLTGEFYEGLRGEMGLEREEGKGIGGGGVGKVAREVAALTVEY